MNPPEETPTDFEEYFAKYSPQEIWLTRYLDHVFNAPKPCGVFDRHHILPKALFPECSSFAVCPWNRVDLSPSDHVVAHYLLYRALPNGCHGMRYAFSLMVGRFYVELLQSTSVTKTLVLEIADEYQKLRECGIGPNVRGWVRIYKDDEAKIVPAEEEQRYLTHGWTRTAPEREWMFKGKVSRRVLLAEVDTHLAKGFILGRPSLSAATRQKISEAVQRNLVTNPATYSKNKLRGKDHPLYGVSPSQETRDKIATTLTGFKQSMESIAKRREAMLGKHWKWSDEKRAWWAEKMTGPGNNRYGLPGHWAGKTRPAESVAKMKATVQKNLEERPEIYNQNKPCGENHWTFGKERPVETRDKIAASLTGKTHSQETKDKRGAAIALTRMPTFSPEDEAKFHALIAAAPEDRPAILKSIKGNKPRAMAKGILIILEGRQAEFKPRYYRMSKTWMQYRSAPVAA